MSLTVNSYIVADAKTEWVSLQPLVGAYELTFSLSAKINSRRENKTRWIALHAARVRVRSANGQLNDLGLARPTQPIIIRQTDFISNADISLNLVLHPHQLPKLEDKRDANDLNFELAISGEGGVLEDASADCPVNETMWKQVGRSDWINQLASARALDVLLLEVPIPFTEASEEQRNVVSHLRSAQKYFVEGHYESCVSECRNVFDELGTTDGAFKALGSAPRAMSKDERESAILAVLRHYTHLAHHSEIHGGGVTYSRAEAKLLLTLATACAVYRAE